MVPLLIILFAALKVEALYGAMRVAVIPLYLSLSLIHELYTDLVPGARGKTPFVSLLMGIALYLAPFVLLDVIRARTLKSR